MKYQPQSPFDSIESAHEFMSLFAAAIADTRHEIDADVERELIAGRPRRLEAVRLAQYNLEKLELHVSKSRRILNDLRNLRRLLFEERKTTALAAPSRQAPVPAIEPPPRKIEAPAVPLAATGSSAVPVSARTGTVAAA
jgi:hypothetical protein